MNTQRARERVIGSTFPSYNIVIITADPRVITRVIWHRKKSERDFILRTGRFFLTHKLFFRSQVVVIVVVVAALKLHAAKKNPNDTKIATCDAFFSFSLFFSRIFFASYEISARATHHSLSERLSNFGTTETAVD